MIVYPGGSSIMYLNCGSILFFRLLIMDNFVEGLEFRIICSGNPDIHHHLVNHWKSTDYTVNLSIHPFRILLVFP